MSRALNINATEAHVRSTSAKHNAAISAIEPLLPRGTRVVYMNATDAATVAEVYGSKVLTGPVTRTPFRPARPR
ncbi:hypothetical protein [Sphingomonas sp. M1-B02]|uniref:hypothetical protein n=1 Tax=Sphingomonas sp. M1-B02 TaxID=3114300 RepID=UPI00223F1C58|nr:hypothetical protein [Sphingomonas sp. S6-11]UZK64696.1 hypothetical protein OKW87_09085 [Sphingomonas sp. S6-11]